MENELTLPGAREEQLEIKNLQGRSTRPDICGRQDYDVEVQRKKGIAKPKRTRCITRFCPTEQGILRKQRRV